MSKLIVVQCGQRKIWKGQPTLGPIPAKDAYTSPYYQKNRAYAEHFGDGWVILSAKYGFVRPDELINDYNVTFKKKSTGPITVSNLSSQVNEKKLYQYDEIIVLGGEEYLEAVTEAFRDTNCKIISPFKGLSIGLRMSAVDKALAGMPHVLHSERIPQKEKSICVEGNILTSTDEIRKYVIGNILEPARKRGEKEIVVRAGDIHSALRLKSRMPSVCSALSSKIDIMANVQIVNIETPLKGKGANFYVTYRF